MMRVFPILVSIFILFAASMTFIAVDSSTAAEKVDLEAAKATFEDVCSRCHPASRALGKKKDQAEWTSTVSRMASYHERKKGGPVSDEDQKAIVQYLVEVAGK